MPIPGRLNALPGFFWGGVDDFIITLPWQERKQAECLVHTWIALRSRCAWFLNTWNAGTRMRVEDCGTLPLMSIIGVAFMTTRRCCHQPVCRAIRRPFAGLGRVISEALLPSVPGAGAAGAGVVEAGVAALSLRRDSRSGRRHPCANVEMSLR